MPVRHIGRPTTYRGKWLFELLRNLKNFGVGRMVVRSLYERYPEPTYYIIRSVQPVMDVDGQYGKMEAETVFRGRDLGVQSVSTAFKSDWRLIPKDEEEQYKKTMRGDPADLPPKGVVPSEAPFPPLLRRMVMEEAQKAGNPLDKEPMLPLTIARGVRNIPIQEGVEAAEDAARTRANPLNTMLPESMAGRLFLSNRNVKK